MLDGMLAYFTIWDGILLSSNEVISLANGTHPMSVRPDSIVTCLPLDGVNKPEFDFRNAPASVQIGTALGRENPPVEDFDIELIGSPEFPVSPMIGLIWNPLLGPIGMSGYIQ